MENNTMNSTNKEGKSHKGYWTRYKRVKAGVVIWAKPAGTAMEFNSL
jgi:hypothetical protein